MRGRYDASMIGGSSSEQLRLNDCLFLFLVPLCLLFGCTTALAPGESGWRQTKENPLPTQAGVGPGEERSLLLLLEDRRLFEPVTVGQAMLSGPETKARLALVLGRVAHPEGLHLLEEFLLDPDQEVRRNAAFSFLVAARRGDLPEAFVRPERGLAGAVSDPDPDVARWALQTMAVSGVGLEGCMSAVERRLAGRNQELELWETLAGALFFLPENEAKSAALLGLERLTQLDAKVLSKTSSVRSLRRELFAAWSTGDLSLVEASPRSLAMARAGLRDDDPVVRTMAAKVLGAVGGAEDIDPLLQLSNQVLSSTGPESAFQHELETGQMRAAGLRAAGNILDRGLAVAPRDFTSDLIDLLEAPSAEVRNAAHEIADSWLLNEDLSKVLIEGVSANQSAPLSKVHTGVLSLIALAAAEHPRSAELVERSSRAADPEWRLGAASAAGLLGLSEPLERLSTDVVPKVRAGVLRARLQALALSKTGRIEYLETALEDSSIQVRTEAYDYLSTEPDLDLKGLLIGLDRLPASSVELRLAAIESIYHYAQSTARERGGAIALLEKLAEDPAWTVRRLAARRLTGLGRPRPEVKKPGSLRGPDYYRGITRSASGIRQAVLETTAGELTLTFECTDAPQICVNILQLAEQGFYDGLPFFEGAECVLATGDPDGSGRGGPGYRLRDEPVALRADRPGVVLLRRTAPDSGASQLAITTCAAHQLDGDWPAIGRVVEGLSVLSALAPGQEVLRFREKR